MGRQELLIRFADLRRLAREVPAYLAASAYELQVPGLRAGVEDALGLAGDDTVDLLRSFAHDYKVELAGFDFQGCISPEPVLSGPAALLAGLAGSAILLKLLAGALYWPLSPQLARSIWQWQLPASLLPTFPDHRTRLLTGGDFVASAAAGRFVTRGQVRFRLLPA